jgi:hypothetical protein
MDPGESTELAKQYPAKLKKLQDDWENNAQKVGVVLTQ